MSATDEDWLTETWMSPAKWAFTQEWEQVWHDSHRKCQDSRHPSHEPCGGHAHFVVSWRCAPHGQAFARDLCSGHVIDYVRAVIDARWCPCVPDHRTCPTTAVKITPVD